MLLSQPALAIYSTEFESKSLGKNWKTGKIGQGQVRISTGFQPISYMRHLVLDSKRQGADSVAEATLQFPLSNYYGVTLGFSVKSLGNQPDAPPEGIFGKSQRQFDGVSVSNDGVRWICIKSLADIGPNPERFYIPLDEAAAQLGGYGKNFQIRFSWRGSGVAGSDGLAIDEVSLSGAWDNRVSVIAPPVVVEGAPPVKVRLTRRLVTKHATTIFLNQVPAGVLELPSTVTFPPKAAWVEFAVSAVDDGLLDPHRRTVIYASEWTGNVGNAAVRVGDVTPLALSLELPDSVTEGEAAKEGRLVFNRPPDAALTVALGAGSGEMILPASVAVPFGEMVATFPVEASDDWVIDGDTEVQVSAGYPGGNATSSIVAADDDSADLRVTMPDSIAEGATVSGSVRLGAGSAGPVTVSLDAGPHLSVEPATLVLSGPPFTANFTLSAADDGVAGPVRRETVRATAAGYAAAEKVVRLLDDEPSSFRVEPVSDVVVPGLPFIVRIQALDAEGEPLPSVNGSLPLQMISSDGQSVPPTPSSVTLVGGVWQGEITPPGAGGIPVELAATHATGISAVSALDFSRTLPWKAADLALDPVRGKIYAAMPKFQPQHSNTILAIDPATGEITGSLALSNNPFKLAITDGGEFLYVALQDSSSIEQIDLTTFSVVRTIALGSSPYGGPVRVQDMTTVAGSPDLLVATLREAFTTAAGGVVVFERGVARPEQISMFDGRCILIERSDDPSRFFCYNSQSTEFGFRWVGLSADGVRVEQTFQGLFSNSVSDQGGAIDSDIVSDGPIVFHTNGRRVDGRVPRRLQDFQMTGPVRPDLATGRVYYLKETEDWWVDRYDRLVACDPESSEILFDLALPDSHGSPGSFLRWGEKGLAFRSDKGITLFNGRRSLPAPQTVDLAVTVDGAAALGDAGESFSFKVDIANVGPNPAPNSQVTVDLSGCDLETIAAPGMPYEQSGRTLTFSPGVIAAGATKRIVLTVEGSSRTLAGCSARAFAAARELTPADNSDNAMVVVGFEPGRYSFNQLELPVSDLFHDSTRGLIWMALRGSAGPGLGKSVVSIDPSTGLASKPIALHGEPAKMVMSDNGAYLYVALVNQPEVKRIHLPTHKVDLHIPMGSGLEAARLFAGDMEVLKGDGRSLLVSRYDPSIRPDHKGVAVYDDDVMRPQVTQGHTGSNVIEASADPELFFGYNNDSTEFGFRHLRVDASGVSEVEVHANIFSHGFGGDLKSTGDTVFSTSGGVVNGKTFSGLGAFANSGPFVPDAAARRVYFIDFATSTQSQFDAISVWDSDRFSPLFSVALPQGYSYPRSFIRWGENGLAFRSESAVAIVSDPQLVPSEPEADLSVKVEATPAEAPVGGEISYTVTLTNHGPYSAADCLVSVSLSGGQSLESVAGAPYHEADGWISFFPEEVAAGQTVVMTVTARATSPGSVTCSATAISASIDSSTAGNSDMAMVPVGFDAGQDAVNRIDLATAGLVEDPVRGVVWASVPYAGPGAERLIVSLDPATGRIVDRIPLLHMPGTLAIAKNGAYLYAELFDREAIQRIDLVAKAPDLLIPLGSDRYAGDIEVLEGDGRSFLVVMQNRTDSLGYAGFAVFDDAIKRPVFMNSGFGAPTVTRIEPSADPSIFFGVNTVTTWPGFFRLKVDASGVVVISETGSLISNFPGDIWSDGDWVFSTRGEVIDGSVPVARDPFQASGLVLPALDSNRVLFLESGLVGGDYMAQRISAYDAQMRSKIVDVPMPVGLEQVDDFIRVGHDHMAFRASGMVLFVRSSQLVPSGPAADLAVTLQANPVPAVVGQPLAYTIQVTNHGANSATGVVVGTILSPHQAIVSVNAGAGSHEIEGQRVRVSLASLPAGATATFVIQVTPSSAGRLEAKAGVTSASVDPVLANNIDSVGLAAGFVSGLDSVRLLRQRANDLIEDSSRGRIWASVPAAGGTGSVVAINPTNGLVTDTLEFPGNPGSLALSKNGRFLYVALTDRPEVQRLDLENKVLDLTISLGSDGPNRRFRADDMVVFGDAGTSILVSRNDEASWPASGLAVYDDATARPVVTSGDGNGSRIEPSPDPSVFYLFNPSAYSQGLRKAIVDGQGVTITAGPSVFAGDYQVGEIRADGNRVVTSSGKLADGDSLTQLGIFPGSTLNRPSQPPVVYPVTGLPWIDAATQRAYFAGAGGIRGYSTDTFAEMGVAPSFGGMGFYDLRKFIRWGQDGFAMLGTISTDSSFDGPGGIMFLRWTAAPYPPRSAIAVAAALAAADPWSVDPAVDSDGDGVTDVFEQLFGTLPTEPGASPLAIVAGPTSAATLRIRFPRRAGLFPLPYRYAVSSDLRQWQPPSAVTERVTGVEERDGVMFETIEAELSKPAPDKGFIRLEWTGQSP